MNERGTSARGLILTLSLGTCGIICFIVFLMLKLTGTIDWDWFWIWFPLWLPMAISLLFFGIVFISIATFDRQEELP